MKKLPIIILSLLSAACVIVCCSLAYTNRQMTAQIGERYLMCSASARQNLESFLSGDENAYEYLISDIHALAVLGSVRDDDPEIRGLTNELEMCHALLISRYDGAKEYLDLLKLNEALQYISDSNFAGGRLRLQSFNSNISD